MIFLAKVVGVILCSLYIIYIFLCLSDVDINSIWEIIVNAFKLIFK